MAVCLTSYRQRHKHCLSHLTDIKFVLHFDIDFIQLQYYYQFTDAIGNTSDVLTVLQAVFPMSHGSVPSKGHRYSLL